jgi:post-segregation antitoxin (ccd killing protein)
MPKKGVTVEHVNLTLPIGMRKQAQKLGINMSYHAAKAIEVEIIFQESRGK